MNEIKVGDGVDLMKRVIAESNSMIDDKYEHPNSYRIEAIKNRSISKFKYLSNWSEEDSEKLFIGVIGNV